jgi:hypothetical protein
MAKHNKKRNTAFIYEVLIREIVKQTINKNKEKRDVAISTIKEIFKKGTILRKELDLYKTLLETNDLNERVAEKLVFEVVKQHKQINKKEIFKEQSNAISIINKQICKNVFNNFVPNYKSLATLAQIFGDSTNPKKKVLLETKVISILSRQPAKETKSKKTSSLVVKTFTQRFNETYSDLSENQKELLSKYVSSFQDNGTEFKFYMNEEITRLKGVIISSSKLEEIKKDDAMKTKLDKVSNILENFNKKPVDKEKILQILKVQDLAKELQSQC